MYAFRYKLLVQNLNLWAGSRMDTDIWTVPSRREESDNYYFISIDILLKETMLLLNSYFSTWGLSVYR